MDFPSDFSETSIFGNVTTVDTIWNSCAGSQTQLQIAPVNTREKLSPVLVSSKTEKKK